MMQLFNSRIIIAIICTGLLVACQPKRNSEKSVTGYRLDEPEKFLMPESLLEVSGVTFNEGRGDIVYAVQDEQGRLFKMKWGVKKQTNSKFGKQGDYEDVAIVSGRVIILKSNGSLFSFALADAVFDEIDSVQEWKRLLPDGEYEGMFGDAAAGKLYIICKNCADDNSKNFVTGYIYDIGEKIVLSGTFKIDVNEIKTFTGKVKRGFRPSAIARNPITGEWYIISAVNKLLVVTDHQWKIRETCVLNGNTFNQPEGIAFDATGNMFISNEGDDFSQGNILKFKRISDH